ncbi:MAG: two pore domain potassium channel family protein, partial [Legionella longbeachae]|nr:two pore domain potassium channel family protein [Legionella longbeachae]
MPHLIARYRFLSLFIILILFCLYKAVNAQLGWFERIDIVFAVFIASSLLIIGHKNKLLLFLMVFFVFIYFIFLILQTYYNSTVVEALKLLFVVVFFILMTCFCLFFTLQDKTISLTTIFGSLSAYMFIGFVFAYIYLFTETVSPMSFTGLQAREESKAIYFSFITLTTVGFGEIVPLKPIVQTLTWIESFTGQSYLAVIIGQLVGR